MTKRIPSLRFPRFSGMWSDLLLGDISQIKTGPFGSTLHQKDYVKFGTPIVTVEHLTDFGLDHKNLPRVSDADRLRLASYSLRENDIVFSRVGSVDRNSLIKKLEEGWLFSGRLLRIRLTSPSVDASFLSKAFLTDKTKYRIRSVSVGQTMASLNTEILKNFSVSLSPSLSEQQEIASFLSAIDDKIQQLQKKKNLLEQYKKGVMQRIFNQEIRFKDDEGNEYPDWERKKLGKIADFRRGSFPQPYGLPKWYDSKGMPFIQVFDVGDDMLLKPTTKSRISEAATAQSVFAPTGTLVITIQGSIGRIAKMQYDAYVDRTLLIFQSYKIPIDVDYFKYVVYLLFEIEKTKAPGGTIKTITKEVLTDFVVQIPRFEEQTKIANFLSVVDQKINLVQQQLDQTKLFKKGLLQQMFV